MVRFLLAIFVSSLWIDGAAAQPLFGNPLAETAAYRSQRADLSEARYRLRYEETLVARGGGPIVSELVIDVAPDWALVRRGERVVLHDYRLNRSFVLGADSYTTMNDLGGLVFRVMERQNRSYLQRMLTAAGAQGELADACDAETELGVAIPGAADAGVTEFGERRGSTTLRCANRDIGGFTPSDTPAPPPAFWPMMFSEMTTHPALHRRVRASRRVPAQLDVSYREATNAVSRRSWRLVAVETVAVPYPLDAASRNATADMLDQLVSPGAGRIAADAIAGRAQGGAPTLQSWGEHLRTMARNEGEAAAAMLLGNTFNMFPELDCDRTANYAACELIRTVRTLDDPAPWAQLEVAIAEQRREPAQAIAAMQRAQASPHRDHPALGATFALALLQFNQEHLAQARAANLPTDIAALQNRALLSFPYNSAYWLDVGDRFGRNYEWPSAFLFYDVGYSLPMASAVERNMALRGKRTQMERIRREFPDAFLPASP